VEHERAESEAAWGDHAKAVGFVLIGFFGSVAAELLFASRSNRPSVPLLAGHPVAENHSTPGSVTSRNQEASRLATRSHIRTPRFWSRTART
jgi:hypothetical protein